MNEKKCKLCGSVKPVSDFYKHKLMKDGYANECKECVKAKSKKWNENNIERKRANSRKWAKENAERTAEIKRNHYLTNKLKVDERYKQWVKDNPEKVAAYKKKWRNKNPEKWLAHYLLNMAVKKGDVDKSASCEDCGVFTDTLHAHHEDYEKPLDVIWLCPSCHGKAHTKI